MDDEVGALHGAAANTPRIAVRNEALAQPGSYIAWLSITDSSHSSGLCSNECATVPIRNLIWEAQVTQAAQAGYAADYQNKRLPLAVHECKEWMKAQKKLVEEVQDQEPVGRLDVAVASQSCHKGGMGAVEVRLIARAPR